MKEDRAAPKPLARPAYNVEIGTENQFIIGYSVHQQADDTTCYVPHLEQQTFPKGIKPKKVSGGQRGELRLAGKAGYPKLPPIQYFLQRTTPAAQTETDRKGTFSIAQFSLRSEPGCLHLSRTASHDIQ